MPSERKRTSGELATKVAPRFFLEIMNGFEGRLQHVMRSKVRPEIWELKENEPDDGR